MIHLVTGACGFLGSAIVHDLVKKNQKVISLDIIEDEKIVYVGPNNSNFKSKYWNWNCN